MKRITFGLVKTVHYIMIKINMSNLNKEEREVRNQISQLLVKHGMPTRQIFISDLLNLIDSLLDKQKINLGMLKQWLNEDRITDINKMVTNEEIEVFINNK